LALWEAVDTIVAVGTVAVVVVDSNAVEEGAVYSTVAQVDKKYVVDNEVIVIQIDATAETTPRCILLLPLWRWILRIWIWWLLHCLPPSHNVTQFTLN
jgi:hypothetical protein